MRLLIAIRLSHTEEMQYLSNNVIYRPDLCKKNEYHLWRSIIDTNAEFVITKKLNNLSLLENNSDKCSNLREVIQFDNKGETGYIKNIGLKFFNNSEENSLDNLFRYLERQSSNYNKTSILTTFPLNTPTRKVALIGSGITNLYTAYQLVLNGFEVSLFDARPDPTIVNKDRHLLLASSFGGEDARLFSFDECRHHFESKVSINQDYFRTAITEGGRLCFNPNLISFDDIEWINSFEKIPTWLAKVFNDDIIAYNKESYDLWLNFIDRNNDIVNASGYKDCLYRVYSSEERFQKSIVQLRKRGEYISELSKEEFININPCFENAWNNGHINNVVRVKGFSFNIHKLGIALIEKIKKYGGTFFWNSEVSEIIRNNNAVIDKILLNNKEEIRAEIFILSPGAYGTNVLMQTSSKNLVSSVIGMWLKLPNTDPKLNFPIKLARTGIGSPGACESANIIPGIDRSGANVIYVSSGHGFIGANQTIDNNYLLNLGVGVIDVVRKYFPNSPLLQENIEENLTYCIRPWTASCLGLFSIEKIENGGMIIISTGHNTGGFAQAAVLSNEILRVISGSESDMLLKYNPKRAFNYLNFGNYILL